MSAPATVSPVFEALELRFNNAMVSNDVAQIAACVAEDWVLVTPERGPIDGKFILSAIEAKVLTHDTMTKVVHRVAIYGSVAVVTGRGQNTGTFRSTPISADEWVTDVYKLGDDGQWRCVLTHLTPAASTHGQP